MKEENFMIKIETIINLPIEVVWNYWNDPEHIKNWYFATEDWHTPFAKNDLKEGGEFLYRMEAKDGSFGFDFIGYYDVIKKPDFITLTLGDGRKVKIEFLSYENQTKVIESFEPESTNSAELQKNGWQSILDNFKKYSEAVSNQ